MGDVVDFNGESEDDISPEAVLVQLAKEKGIKNIFVVIEFKDGEIHCHSDKTDIGVALYLMEKAKQIILED